MAIPNGICKSLNWGCMREASKGRGGRGKHHCQRYLSRYLSLLLNLLIEFCIILGMSESGFTFEVLFDEELIKFCTRNISCVGNENVVSMANDYDEGFWRIDRFLDFIWDNIKDAALTANERTALIGQEGSVIRRAASRLRLSTKDTDKSKGSEIAEILLYGIMRRYYGALPVVPKIFTKQNRSDTVKGADSVHIVLTSDDGFELWFGEAKFYKTISDKDIERFVGSINETLSRIALDKEKSLIVASPDLVPCIRMATNSEATDLIERIRKVLMQETPLDELRPLIHVPILLLYECPLTAKTTEYSDVYKTKLIEDHRERAMSYFEEQIKELKGKIHYYDRIHFHLILFPVANKKSIVDKFEAVAKAHRGG